MNTANCAFCCVFLALSFTPPAAQEGKLIVVNVDSKDLKRTACRLRIPVERVKNAREALQEATDLAKRVRPIQANSVSQLGKLKQGFLLVAELREKEKDPGTKTGRNPATDRKEHKHSPNIRL